MLKYIEIDNTNIMDATKIQMEIFPNESAYYHFKYAIDFKCDYIKYYLVYKDNNVIGITGLYSNEDIYETNSIWLGWFGILPKYRKLGFGKKVLLDTINKSIELSKKYPIKYFRLYTDEKTNDISLNLYDKIMDIKEYYNNKNDINYNNSCLIYSKALNNDKIEKWNNRFLNLKEIIAEEEKSNKLFKK